jgi:hypothetical protein
MKRFLPVAAACFALILPLVVKAAPADSSSTAPHRPNSLHKGASALQLLLDGSLDSGGVALKHMIRDNQAVRFGMMFDINTLEGDSSEDTSATAINGGHSDRRRTSTDISAIIQRYANPLAEAQFFYGFGPFLGLSHESVTRSSSFGADESSESTYTSYSVGVLALIGAEWFASRALSLDVEYEISAGYHSSTSESTSTAVGYPTLHNKDDSSGYFFDAGHAVRFGLGIYF